MTRRVCLVLAFLMGACGCAEPTIPEGTVAFDPPPEYRLWWEASRRCVHKPEVLRYEAVRWYLTPTPPIGSDGTLGAALEQDGRIYIWEPYRSSP